MTPSLFRAPSEAAVNKWAEDAVRGILQQQDHPYRPIGEVYSDFRWFARGFRIVMPAIVGHIRAEMVREFGPYLSHRQGCRSLAPYPIGEAEPDCDCGLRALLPDATKGGG